MRKTLDRLDQPMITRVGQDRLDRTARQNPRPAHLVQVVQVEVHLSLKVKMPDGYSSRMLDRPPTPRRPPAAPTAAPTGSSPLKRSPSANAGRAALRGRPRDHPPTQCRCATA